MNKIKSVNTASLMMLLWLAVFVFSDPKWLMPISHNCVECCNKNVTSYNEIIAFSSGSFGGNMIK